MEERWYGGAKRIPGRPRPTSKSRKTVRRKLPASESKVVVPETSKPSKLSHSSSFPLFSKGLVDKAAILPIRTSSRHKQTTNFLPMARTKAEEQVSSVSKRYSPVPVEEVERPSRRSQLSIDSLSCLTELPQAFATSARQQDSAVSKGQSLTRQSSFTSRKFDDDVFPFQILPDDCKLKIFSYLPSHDKGRAAQVCLLWWDLMRTPRLWSQVSFSEFPFWCITTEEHNCIGNCYVRYRVRVKKFFAFLRTIRPILKTLEFKFDIADYDDGYLQPLEKLLLHSNIQGLKYACLNWKETPSRPFWSDLAMFTAGDEVVQKNRYRQRMFFNIFFDPFTQQTPNLDTLVMPFYWSDRSVDCMLRLQNLHSLVLEKYFAFQSLKQDLLDRLLFGLKCLRRFMLELWPPRGQGVMLYALKSSSIEYLDISQSRGFYVSALKMPNLKRFRVARHPWNGPLYHTEQISIPCLYNVLADGAPNLCKINDHYLEPHWREDRYNILEEVLKGVCSCRDHKTGWAM